MFPYNLLILPLVGGYFIISNFALFKYKYQRHDTTRLLLNSILAGMLVGIGSFICRVFVENLCPDLFDRLSYLINLLPIERTENNRHLGTLTYGLIAVVILTYFSNLIIKYTLTYSKVISRALDKHGDELEQLFRDSVINAMPVQVTLKNDKVYLGIVDRIPEPKKTNYISLIPLFSGYREKDTKKMVLTTSYETINELINNRTITPTAKLLVFIQG